MHINILTMLPSHPQNTSLVLPVCDPNVFKKAHDSKSLKSPKTALINLRQNVWHSVDHLVKILVTKDKFSIEVR